MNATKKMTHKDYFTALLDMPEVMNYPGMTEFIEGRIAALEKKASGIIVVHNHPSGNCEPSEQDIETTKIIKCSADILGIPLLDHIIFSENNYFSFVENKLLCS